jgi:tRNA isopentenyl-2-thiomethyl-A-37 hydroxylase MiaE
VRLAKNFWPEDRVHERLASLAEAEGRIIAAGEEQPRMHS